MPHPGEQHRENHATINPFVEEKPHIATYTAQEIATLQSRLDKQLGPEYISTRPGQGGGKVHYLAAEKVIQLANEIFGFNGWSSQIQNVQVDFVDENATNGKISLGLSTIVRVTLRDGMFHEDIGYGHIENCKGKAAAFEKAKKEATTDALKRALRNFGNVLGNCLYDKDYLTRVAKIKMPPSRWDSERLHRHQDYIEVKSETAVPDVRRRQDAITDVNLPNLPSLGSIEFDEDFGGNTFDESDFTRSDAARIGGPNAPNAVTALNAAKQPYPLPNQPHRTNSAASGVPQANIPRVASPVLRQNGGPVRPAAAAPQTPANKPPQAHQFKPQGQPLADGLKSNQSSGSTAIEGIADDPFPEIPLPMELPPDAPQGFVSARGAGVEVPPEIKLATTAAAFNPHAESPSIRRTQGINPGVSTKILRKQVVGGGASAAVGSPVAFISPAAPIRTNFVNPSADANRRVGMPATPGAMANRGQYRPPTTVGVKRPPLTDVTNQAPVEGLPDSKKPRTDVSTGVPGQTSV